MFLCFDVAKAGKKVLLVDFDPQGNATSGFGVEKNQLVKNCYDVLMGIVAITKKFRGA